MAIHLIKLAVGIDSIEHLRERQQVFADRLGLDGAVPGYTRRRPKRAEEIIGTGSIYWVIKGHIRTRQRILDLVDSTQDDGTAFCLMHLHPDLIAVQPVPKRPFQGWRYLTPGDAPPDLAVTTDGETLPPGLAEDLRDLGVL